MRLKKKKFEPKKIYRSKLFLVGALIVVVLISISLTKEALRRHQINQDIQQLTQEVTDLEERNTELADLIQYLNSTSWQEKEARTKLNLKKPGETMVVTPGSIVEEEEVVEKIVLTDALKSRSNPQKWWRLFIK